MKAALLSILVLVSLSGAFADCSQWPARNSSQFRTTAFDLSVDGDLVWLATGYGVQVFQNGSIVASIGLPGSTRVVRAHSSGIAYVGSGSSVYTLRRTGSNLAILNTAAVTGTVNDLEIVSTSLFAATASGIAHFDIAVPTAPFRTNIALPSSSPNVTSLASAKNKLYAADGDATVEIYSVTIPSLPQHIGTLESAPRASAVHATSDDSLFVSDRFGQTTDLFAGGQTLMARMPIVTTAFAAFSGQTHFVAGPNRTVRAVDFSTPARIAVVFAADLATTDGTVNFIHAMARVDDTLYVAAGDIGMVVIDASTIARPFPLASYSGGATTSVRMSADKAWFSTAAGRIMQQRIDAAGIALIEERAWDAEAGSVVRDHRNNGLLTTSGAKATVWSLVSATPAQATNVTFAEAINNAVTTDAQLVALLADGSVWSAPSGQTTPTRANVPVMTLLARSGSAIALAEVREIERTTVLHFFPTGDLTSTAQKFTVDGAAAGSIALDATRAALFTFNGITVIDIATGNQRVIPASNLIFPRQMTFSGDDLLVMDARKLQVYDDAQTLLRDHALPSEAVAFDATPSSAAIATFEGTAAIRYLAETTLPATPFTSSFYTKLAAASGRAYLLDDDGIDVLSSVIPGSLSYVTTIPTTGTIDDFVATDTALYTLAGNGNVTAYSRAGVMLAQANIGEGFDSQMLTIRTAANAVWASLAVGCTVQGCRERKTLVLDPNTLAVTATMTGSVTDLTVSGARAYALVSFPDEMRVLNVADPQHPAQILAAAAPAFASSIAFSSGKVFVLAGKIFGYSESTLTLVEEHLNAVTANASHRIRIDGNCALVSRDANAPIGYDLPSWTPAASTFTLPSNLRSFNLQPDMLLFLTEHSLDLAYPTPVGKPPRRRAAR
ncbi:MAG: hypothetical protein M3P06_15365 [Acidobacteriota bacterium]|nr:hypothetical protein [Acidobacteriota bacterium]